MTVVARRGSHEDLNLGPPCAQGSEQKVISLVRIAFLCVIEHGFIRYLSAFGPKLDPSYLEVDARSADIAEESTQPAKFSRDRRPEQVTRALGAAFSWLSICLS